MSGMRTTRQRRRGFTLIELLIVISIILVILAIAVPKMNKQMQGAREMAVIREIGSIHQAETQYYSQFGKYATALTQLGPGEWRGRARSGEHPSEGPGGRQEERVHLHADGDTQAAMRSRPCRNRLGTQAAGRSTPIRPWSSATTGARNPPRPPVPKSRNRPLSRNLRLPDPQYWLRCAGRAYAGDSRRRAGASDPIVPL